MYVTIWRHGEAGDAPRDRDRRLTLRGEEELVSGQGRFTQICRQRQVPLPDTIYYSPWRRAVQTAGIIGAGQSAADCREHSALRPDSDLPTVDTALANYAIPDEAQHVVLVSHQPLVSRLVDHYLGSYGAVPSLAPGAFAMLSLDTPLAGCASAVCWAFPPDYQVGH